jgi:hypothetical protein
MSEEQERKKIQLSPQDYYYVKSPGFESYMISGLVFVFGITFSIVGSVAIHQEPLFWPGSLLSIVAAFFVLRALKRREFRAKLREVQERPYQPKTPPDASQ